MEIVIGFLLIVLAIIAVLYIRQRRKSAYWKAAYDGTMRHIKKWIREDSE